MTLVAEIYKISKGFPKFVPLCLCASVPINLSSYIFLMNKIYKICIFVKVKMSVCGKFVRVNLISGSDPDNFLFLQKILPEAGAKKVLGCTF